MSSLYKISIGSTDYTYTSGQSEVTYDGDTYAPSALERSEIFFSLADHKLTLKLPQDTAVVTPLLEDKFSELVTIEVRANRTGYTLLFKGYVNKVITNLKNYQVRMYCSAFPQGSGTLPNFSMTSTCKWAWSQGFTDANPSALSGTINSHSTSTSDNTSTLTGSSTSFDSDFVKNDFVSIDGYIYRVTVTPSSTTSMVVHPTLWETPSTSSYYKVTSIDECPVQRSKFVSSSVTVDGTHKFDASDKTQFIVPGGHDLVSNGADSLPKYKWGIAVFKDSGGNEIEKGYVVQVESTYIRFLKPVRKNADVTSIEVYQGCSKKWSTCKDKFRANFKFGAFPNTDKVTRYPEMEGVTQDVNSQTYIPDVFGIQWVKGAMTWFDDQASFIFSPQGGIEALGSKTLPPETSNVAGYWGYYRSYILTLARHLDSILAFRVEEQGIKDNGTANEMTVDGMVDSSRDYFPKKGGESFYIDASYCASAGDSIHIPRQFNRTDITESMQNLGDLYPGSAYEMGGNYWGHRGSSGNSRSTQKFTFYDGTSNSLNTWHNWRTMTSRAFWDPDEGDFTASGRSYVIAEGITGGISPGQRSRGAFWGYASELGMGSLAGKKDDHLGKNTKPKDLWVDKYFKVSHYPYISSSAYQDIITEDFTNGTGTISEITSGSAIVRGSGTAFLTELLPDDILLIDGNYYRISSITSNILLTLTANASTTAAGVSFTYGKQKGANPACVVYYVMKESLKISASSIDTSTFQTARNSLWGEQLDLNVTLSSPRPALDFIKEILDFTYSSLIWDISLGTPAWSLTLMRASQSSVKTYSTSNCFDISVSSNTYNDLFSELVLPFTSNEDVPIGLKQSYSNDLIREIVGFSKTKKVSNPLVNSLTAASFYLSIQATKLCRVSQNFTFNIPVTDLFTVPILEGSKILFNSSEYPLGEVPLRVNKISGFSEFTDKAKINANLDFDSVAGRYVPIAPSPALIAGFNITTLDAVEAIPTFFDTPFLSSSSGLPIANFSPAKSLFVLSAGGTMYAGMFSEVEMLDISSNAIDSFDLPFAYKGTLNSALSPGAWIDKGSTGILIDTNMDIGIKTVSSSEYDNIAIISKFNGSSQENSDYEMIAFKTLEEVSAPSDSSGGQYRITDIVRNIAGSNYYDADPYASSSQYVGGSTNKTGQFTHRSGSQIWVLTAGASGHSAPINQYVDFDSDSDGVFDSYRVALSGKGVFNTDKSSTANTFDLVVPYADASPFIFKFNRPYPPSQLFGYRTVKSANMHYYILYIGPSAQSGGACWRNPDSSSTIDKRPSMDLVVEYADTEGTRSIRIVPSENIAWYFDLGNLPTVNNEHIEGYITSKIGGYDFDESGSDNVSSISSAGEPVVLRESFLNRQIEGYACFILNINGASLSTMTFKVYHELNGLRSIPRQITIDTSDEAVIT